MTAQGVRLSDLANGRDNNFNLIRILAAGAVIVSHAFPIALGIGAEEPLEAQTGYHLGTLAVFVFFAVSGFLITQSFDRKPQVAAWASARIMRLFPGLVVALVLTAMVYGPAFTADPVPAYFANLHSYLYIPRNLALFPLQYGLPGVFADLPYPDAINGSLWTLGYEVVCYLGVLACGLAGILASKRAFAIVLVVGAVAGAISCLPAIEQQIPGRLLNLRQLAYPFAIGMALYVWRERIVLRWWILALLAGLSFLVHGTPLFAPVFVATLSFATFVLAYRIGGPLRAYNRLGDYSYGLYIYAFPVQQAVSYFRGAHSPFENMALAIPVTLLLAIASWHLVEHPALERRGRLAALFGKVFARFRRPVDAPGKA